MKFISSFQNEMQDFILLKRSIGYKYATEAGILSRFDRYLAKMYPELRVMTKEAVFAWCAKTPHEKPANQCSRASVVRQFCKYLDSIGKKAYILPKNYYATGPQYIPHIYTLDELNRFFDETDKCKYCSACPNRHLIMPIFYRLLFSCGLRCSEARLLKVGEVDLDTGTLTITESKNHNSRLVPMPDSITKRMKNYFNLVHKSSNDEEYFFPFSDEKPMTVGNIYKNFRRFLWQARISHTGDGPRVHDFRHSYAVYRLKTWSEQNKDLLTLLPALRTYLGHDSFYETSYYLRMTADVFPDIQLKLETAFAGIIPELEGEEYEAD
jgi:integrase